MPATVTTYTAPGIAAACGGRLIAGAPGAAADSVCTDTRKLQAGQAFFALRGETFDGHDYLPRAVQAGATVFVVDHLPSSWRAPDGWRAPEGTAVVRVANTARALLALAGQHRSSLKGRVVAITGSFGKSTVKSMTAAILSRAGRCSVAPKSFNNRVGVALTLLAAGVDDDYVVLEMGTNHPGEIDELARAARPHLGVITAIGEVHLEGLGDLAGVREAKAEMIRHIVAPGRLVLNGDCVLCTSLAGRCPGWVRTFGMRPGCSVQPERVLRRGDGWCFDALGQRFYLPVSGRYNVINAAAAICAALELGVPPQTAAEALACVELPAMRYERRRLGDVLFVCDCYNSNPTALRAALESFMAEPVRGSRVVVCGDMLELGRDARRIHRRLGAELAASGVDMLIAVGPLARSMLVGWQEKRRASQASLHFETAEKAWLPLYQLVSAGDAVLLKGSRRMALEIIPERISQALQQQKEAA
jgi:UDP-N-acetylmuramoyl-tripeptide--D-alanyl-D-alanine ligase